jgi:hypothetical protein
MMGQTMPAMTAEQVATLTAQRDFRGLLELMCKEKGYSFEDVFFADRDWFVDPNRRGFGCAGPEDSNGAWLKAYIAKGGDPNAVRWPFPNSEKARIFEKRKD